MLLSVLSECYLKMNGIQRFGMWQIYFAKAPSPLYLIENKADIHEKSM